MTQISRLSLQNFRNCRQVDLDLGAQLNLIVGDNAAGKTSLIEAVWLLATGRSFRTQKVQHLIEHEQAQCTVFAKLISGGDHPVEHRLGLTKQLHNTQLRLNGESVSSQSEIAQRLPVQLLTPESHKLLEEGPKARRRFMDWGCFYQFPEFHPLWRHYKRGLAQRNHALKQKLPQSQVQLWDDMLVSQALQIDHYRQDYLQQLTPYLNTFCDALMPELKQSVACQYRAGWPKNTDNLLTLFRQNFSKDRQVGHTQYGAHRADIRFKLDQQEAIHGLSRGQQKLFVCALLLAQACLHEKISREPVIMLIDDLPAELDEKHRLKLLELLDMLNIQHLITTTSKDLIPILKPDQARIWQVTSGQIHKQD
ncbi:DNA replication/repair protein RecF [Thiomicrorhabdus heinhorstiae]|uniref:DNA replication and repair protein RecF n=1 Tax=Thiomicrorhabdus heinhorstiae TaxID=2748010 RepID=A0ABS0BYR2_9GAMM|nr:DNA replication/repair protein RecF [Thiomicrorhabdus heinhorstiae]MBF6058933.1 DNA replication/repair protein RecF [Thiomicrorhabdus heinhorstiae]